MKPVRRVDSTSQSCSCTSCLYKSESEQPSIRKYVAHGSRIDRLYYGKYIPLRERKLLDRLVRTRAVYDDLRARLISDSTLSLEKNADLRPGKHQRVIKTLDSEKSGAILELVDIIDKGAALGPKKLSECCSCCSCSSKSKIVELPKKDQRRKRVREVHTYEAEYGQTGQTGTGEGFNARMFEKKHGKKGPAGTGEGVFETYEREYAKTVPEKMGERYNKRGVRFKAKHIRSDPCTCTFKFSGLITKHSKAMFKKLRPLPLEQPYFDAEEQYIVEKTKKQNFARKSIQKYKKLRNKLDQDMRKLNESKANMKQNLKIRAQKSLEQVKQAKNKIKTNVESGVRKSIQAVKGLHGKDKEFESIESPELETTFKIKKDSIVKFKDYLKRKQMMKDWECDLECEPDICVPEECFKIIKLRKLHKGRRHRDRKQAVTYEDIKHEVKVGGAPLTKSSSGVQAGQYVVTTETHIKKQKPVLRGVGKNQIIEKELKIETKKMKQSGAKAGIKKSGMGISKSSLMSATYGENDLRNISKKGHMHKKHMVLKENERFDKKHKPHSRGRQAVRITSSFSFDVEFSKNRPGMKSSRSSQPSGIHMHAPRHKRRKVPRQHDESIESKSSIESSQSNHRTRLVQTDKYGKGTITSKQEQLVPKASHCECEKRLSDVKTNTDYDTKSVSSLTSKSTTDKIVSKEVKQKARLSQVSILPSARLDTLASPINEGYSKPKQAVRIGSTFSFQVEFYKKSGQNESKAPVIKKKVKHANIDNKKSTTNYGTKPVVKKKLNVKGKLLQVKGTSTNAYNQAKTTLRRCFCTLKLHEHIKTGKKIKTTKTAAVSCLCETPPESYMIDKYVETKKSNRSEAPKLYDLLPYECEPGICVPDECDPILCKKILDLRKRRFKRRISKSVGSYTDSRKTKSTSSVVSRPFATDKAKIVQSSIAPTKAFGTNAPRRYKNLNLGRNEIFQTNKNTSDRQAVRIGSSFSFNIEFYKDKQNPITVIATKPSLSSTLPAIEYKQRKIEKQDNNKRNKSMLTQVINVDKYIGPTLKNCLCTLKLYKNKVSKKKPLKQTARLTINTQTSREAPIGESVDRGTRTKKEHYYKLLPYECEPYICVPGECDPYICLEKIKRREQNTRNISAFTDQPEMRSMSSITDSLFKKSEAILVQPKLFRKGTNMKSDYVTDLNGKPRPAGEIIKTSKSKQAVRIGSSFNFSIEFSKQLPGETLNKRSKIKEYAKVHPKMNRDKGITVTKVRVDHVDTQSLEPRKNNRGLLVRPMLKRCFCTLNLQKKTKQQHRKDLTSGGEHFGPNVYTVGRATTKKIISHTFGSHINAKVQLIEPKNKIISISTSSFLLNKYVESLKAKHRTVNLYSTFKIPIKLKQPLIIQSNLSMKLDIKQLGSYKESRICCNKKSIQTFSHAMSYDCLKPFSQQSNQNLKKITDISKYLERCFCTMNVQILNQGGNPAIKKITNKLQPYECEPGICVPGECDPYECKKLIMRRFVKNAQKGSGTNSKSISSNAGFDSRSTQIQTRPHARSRSQVTIPQKVKPQWKLGLKQKQAVRIKSSFSFDLEFYKHTSQPFKTQDKLYETSTYIVKPENEKLYKTTRKVKGTQENKVYDKENKVRDKENQVRGKENKGREKENKGLATVSYVNRGTASMTKRCFCTLKLQKKGKIQRELAKTNNQPQKELPAITSKTVKVGTINEYQKIPLDSNNLKFYECEPGICIPGQCDPYKCLELMKRRKNLGVNTIINENKPVSSMTNEEKYKTRAVDIKPKRTHHKSTKAIKYHRSIENMDSNISGRSSRPAVRIGSSFSFNIEFFKDMPQVQQYKEVNVQNVKVSKSDTKQIKDRKLIKAVVTPSSKSVSHKGTVTQKPFNQEAKIITFFVERCFCTKKLHSKKDLKQHNVKNFKDKCFCILGLNSKRNKEYQPTAKPGLDKANKDVQPVDKPTTQEKGNTNNQHLEKRVQTTAKPANTNKRQKAYLHELEPYECEPGICIPGKCNPYFCEKIIQHRLAKQYSKKSETESVRTQSVSSNFGTNKRSKNERNQAHGQTHQKRIQYQAKHIPPTGKGAQNAEKRLGNVTLNEGRRRDDVILNEDSRRGNGTLNAGKRLVRIGSNFSFNIEFYKENVNGDVTEEKKREVKTYPINNIRSEKKTTENVSKTIGTETVNVRTNKQQIKNKTKASGASPLLKRCFCTLKLMNKPFVQTDRNIKANRLNEKPIIPTKTVETQSNKRLEGQLPPNKFNREVLSPYECEPFVCVPGECDPVECLKRIKRRQQRTKEFGTTTKYPKRKSIGSVATRKRDENVQVMRLKEITNKGVQKRSYGNNFTHEKSYNQQKQAVRIGSNFSFNIEFFKDIENGLPKIATTRPIEEVNIPKIANKNLQKHTKTQSHFKHDVDVPVATTKLQNTETTMAHLKRCFCTLPLQQKRLSNHKNPPIKIQSNQPKSEHSSVGDFLKKCICTLKLNKVGKEQHQPPTPAVKYEIKGTSTPGRRVQQDRIKNPVRTLEPYECEPYFCVPGECNPYECLKRIQQRQVRDFGTEYKRYVKDSAIGTDYKRYIKDSATDSIKQPETKSTKAQYHQKRKFNLKETSLASKRGRHSQELGQFSSLPTNNTNKQVVRIGSNFSFNIEFFKDHSLANNERSYKGFQAEKVPNMNTLQLKQTEKTSKSRRSISTVKRLRNKYSQCIAPKKQPMYSMANVGPKRCFCTLKLLNKTHHLTPENKIISPTIETKDKMTATKVKYAVPQELGIYECPPLMCIPGECNPYECLEKIRRREIMRKSRPVGPRVVKTSIASVGNRPIKQKIHKVQSQVANKRNIVVSTPHSEPQSEILKSSRITEKFERRNKRAVRIGSNFNFNVEFFKQKSQPAVINISKIVKARGNEEGSKFYENKNVAAGARNFQHKSHITDIKMKNQASDAGNILKRCFCTLQLQKPPRQNIKRSKNSAIYPQTYTIGRVAVEPLSHVNRKIKKADKARSTSIDNKLLNKSVGTKTNKKYTRNVDLPTSQCNPSNCPEYKKRFYRRKTENDMHTILPYTPSKFHKKESKTYVSDKHKLEESQRNGKGVYNLNDPSMLRKGRRKLTAKKSSKSIPTDALDTKSNNKNSFFCRCVRFFSRRSETRSAAFDKQDNINKINKRVKPSITNNQPANIKLLIPPRKGKSFGETCPYICPDNCKETEKKYLQSQSGDAKYGSLKAHTKENLNYNHTKTQEVKKKHPQMRVTFADTSEYTNNNTLKKKPNKSMHSKSSARSRLCYSCSANDCPLKYNNLKDDSHSISKSMKSNKKAVAYSESADDCQYCECCKRKIHTDEISKGGGDRRLSLSSQSKQDTCPCGKESIINDNERKPSLHEKSRADIQKFYTKRDKCCSKIKPLLEMRIDSVDQDIINKSEVKKTIDQLYVRRSEEMKLQTKHPNTCICCKCLKKREKKGAKISVPAKGATNTQSKFEKMFAKNRIAVKQPLKNLPRKHPNPCICGSKKCATELKRKSSKTQKAKIGKYCICGSPICSTETKKLKRNKQRLLNKAKKKIYSDIEKKEMKALLRRIKIRDAKEEIRRLKRIRRNAELERRVKKYKDASDVMLAVDSLADIGRLGLSTAAGALRYTTKSFIDPKVACERLCRRCRHKDPESIRKQLQRDYLESDAAATLRRLKIRCMFSKGIRSLRERLEDNRFTHFILHIADKNAKSRVFKPRPKRRFREPLDFQCSLYMATLRKRPYLSVYYKWPWFYPHFIGMLNIWKQFTDIMLFLLAAVVWSPCILCMEGCRALMCCFFCTG